VTSGNMGHGLIRVPQISPTFPLSATVCSVGARLFRSGPCRRVLTSTFPARLVWIMASAELNVVQCGRRLWDIHTPGSIRPVAVPTCGTPRRWTRARATAALGTVALATHLISVGRASDPTQDRSSYEPHASVVVRTWTPVPLW